MSIPVYGVFEGGKTLEERWGEKEDKPGQTLSLLQPAPTRRSLFVGRGLFVRCFTSLEAL